MLHMSKFVNNVYIFVYNSACFMKSWPSHNFNISLYHLILVVCNNDKNDISIIMNKKIYYLDIYNRSNYFTCNCCKVIVYSSFSDKSTITEMCNDDKQSIMLYYSKSLTVYHSYTFRVIKIKTNYLYLDNEKYLFI